MDVSFIATAFLGGLVSFLAPCVLPIIPGFLAYLAGVSTDTRNSRGRFEIFLNSFFFVLGFSIVFAVLGVLINSILANVAREASLFLSRIGGIIIIFFGLYLTGLLKIPFLDTARPIRVTRKFNSRYLTSFVFGLAFAAGWTPCVGAALGAILGLAASAPGLAFTLLFAYALGLGLPFLAVGYFAGEANAYIQRLGPKLRYITIVFGVALILLGILVFTQQLSLLANFELLNRFLLQS